MNEPEHTSEPTGAAGPRPAGRGRRRPKRYTARLTLVMTPEARAALQAAADAADMSAADVARDCLKRGLPLFRDSLRKAQTRERTD